MKADEFEGAEGLAALRSRVTMPQPHIIQFFEVSRMSRTTVARLWDRVDEFTANLPYWFMLLDLSEMPNTPPNAQLRADLRDRFGKRRPEHAAVIAGKNHLLGVAAKFIMRSMLGGHKVTMHSSREDALAHLVNLAKEWEAASLTRASVESRGV